MRTISIGIIGGCMTCQKDLKLSQLFYRSVMRELLENDKVKCFVNLRYYNEYFRIPEKGQELLKAQDIDMLIVQIRPAPYIIRSEFLIQDYQGKFIVNPLLRTKTGFHRIESILGTKEPVILQMQDIEKRRWDRLLLFALLKYNLGIGGLFRLDRKAAKSLVSYMITIKSLCDEKGLPLIVIGPINSFNKKNNSHLGKLNDRLRGISEKERVPYVDAYSIFKHRKEHYFGPDMSHLNEKGHEVIANELYRIIKMMVPSGGSPINS